METVDLSQLPDEDDHYAVDEDDPGEGPTSFATKGVGWSGRNEPVEDDPPA